MLDGWYWTDTDIKKLDPTMLYGWYWTDTDIETGPHHARRVGLG